jgi:hypothetical protein
MTNNQTTQLQQIAATWAVALNSGSTIPDLIWRHRDLKNGYMEMTPDYVATMRRREVVKGGKS